MEACPVGNKKAMKKESDQMNPKYDPGKAKVVSTEKGEKSVVEWMTNCDQQFNDKDTNKIHDKFDPNKNNQIDKNNQTANNFLENIFWNKTKFGELTEKITQKMKTKSEKKK
jgi:hypothetical protein